MTQAIVAITALIGTAVMFWIVSRAWPYYRVAMGQTRGFLGSIIALFLTIGLGNVFWFALILLPAAVRGEGGAAYPFVVGGFVVIQLLPVTVAVYLWRKLGIR